MKRCYLILTLYIISITLFVSCSNDVDDFPSTTEDDAILVDKVWTVAQTNPDGFTVDIRSMTSPKEGISVAYAATQNSFGKESLPNVIAHSRAHANYVGGWLDDTVYYFDSDTLFAEKDLDAAIAFGKQQKQKAIYIISKDSTIYLK